MTPIFFRGSPFSFPKRYFQGTHRSSTPEETWEKIEPLSPRIGVTRVADITGLDRIGIPVAISIRPATITLSVSSGKGATLLSAYVSALMESFEIYSAENAELPIIRSSYNDLAQNAKMIPLDILPLRKNSLFQASWPERWTPGWDLLAQEEAMAPLFSVIMNFQILRSDPQEISSFTVSSNGLASGNHFLEAASSAIYEAIERDAIACHLFASAGSSYYPPRIELSSIPYPSVQALIAKMKKAQVRPLVYDCRTDTEVPVYMAVVYDQRDRHAGITNGYGAHLDPEVALIRALTEAVQGRAVVNAGSRDDNFSSLFQIYKKFDSKKEVDDIENSPGTSFSCQSEATLSFEGDVALLLSKLKSAGVEQVIAFDLTPPDFPVSAVRIVIPGLEGYYSNSYVPGKRAKRYAMEKKDAVRLKPSLKGLHFPAGAQI